MKTIKDIPVEALQGKRVLVRVDWNAPIEQGRVTSDFRLRASLPTIQFLQAHGAQVTVVTHLGADGRQSVEPLRAAAATLCPAVTVLENLRQNPGEEANDPEFAKQLAAGFDWFVNDAFAVCHRAHASVVGVPEFLPSYAGFLVEREVAELSRAFNPEHPFIFILGGAKFSTKAPLVAKFLKLADRLFIGGALANTCFKARGWEIGRSVADENVELVKSFVVDSKLLLPEKVVAKLEGDNLVSNVRAVSAEASIEDIAPEALLELGDYLKTAALVVWNGPLGRFETGYLAGTEALAGLIAMAPGRKIIGGGDTIAAVERLGLVDRFDFVSTGGGAMLDFLANETLPGLEALTKSQTKFGL